MGRDGTGWDGMKALFQDPDYTRCASAATQRGPATRGNRRTWEPHTVTAEASA